MNNWKGYPLSGVGEIRFGMTRSEVRAKLNCAVVEFKKNKFSKTITDNFGICHVFYDENDCCVAVEIFGETIVSLGETIIFPTEISVAKNLIADAVIENDSLTSISQSIGIYAPDGKMESILFGCSGYYV